MIFEDRLSAYPNRYKVTDDNGRESMIVLERADDPLRLGTPLNAETFNKMQEELQVESVDFPGCYYRVVDTEQEWFNPPMEEGVEYRTVERYHSKPVYIKRVTLPVSRKDEQLDSTISATATIVDFLSALYNNKDNYGIYHRLPIISTGNETFDFGTMTCYIDRISTAMWGETTYPNYMIHMSVATAPSSAWETVHVIKYTKN